MIDQPGTPESRSTRLGDTLLIVGVRIAVLGLLAYWTFVLTQPFLVIIIWSIIFAVALYPLFASLNSLLRGRKKLAAATITLATLIIIFGPATWLGLSLADSVRVLIERFGDGSLTIPPPPDTVKNWPLIGPRAYETWQLASTNLKLLIADVAPYFKPLGGRLLGVAGSFGINLVKFVIAPSFRASCLFPVETWRYPASTFWTGLRPGKGRSLSKSLVQQSATSRVV